MSTARSHTRNRAKERRRRARAALAYDLTAAPPVVARPVSGEQLAARLVRAGVASPVILERPVLR